MNHRITFLALTAVAVGITAAGSRSAIGGQGSALVRLQATSPGSVQAGHLNISGEGRFGSVNVQAGGRVGIGELTPLTPLHVSSPTMGADSGGLLITHANQTQGVGIGYNSVYAAGTHASQDLGVFAKGTGSVLLGPRISVNGKITVTNGATPVIALDTAGAIVSKYLNVGNAAGGQAVVETQAGSSNALVVYNNSNENIPALWVENRGGGMAGHFVGTLSATSKSFIIDHPLDPGNKYLIHSCIESDERRNLYDGTAELDAQGEATITMPEWFEALNREFRYQLTSVGAPGRDLYIAQKIKGNTFRIAGGQPFGEVCWQVTGVRKDAFAEAHPFKAEEDKGAHRGKYISPQLFGQPASKGGAMQGERPNEMK